MNKLNTIQLFLLALACSCNFIEESHSDSRGRDSLSNSTKISFPSTTYEFPNIELPKNFYLDSITIYDTISRASYTAYCLQSNLLENKKFNQEIQQFVKGLITIEQSYIDSYNENSPIDIIHSFLLRPVEIYTDSKIISVSNIIDTYTEGGNHHNYVRSTFNFNLNTNKLIQINDIFSLYNKNDSTEFVRYAEQHTNDCIEWGWPYKNLDFSFTENGIYINPNLSWACVATRSLLPLDEGNNFIKKEWIKIKSNKKTPLKPRFNH